MVGAFRCATFADNEAVWNEKFSDMRFQAKLDT